MVYLQVIGVVLFVFTLIASLSLKIFFRTIAAGIFPAAFCFLAGYMLDGEIGFYLKYIAAPGAFVIFSFTYVASTIYHKIRLRKYL